MWKEESTVSLELTSHEQYLALLNTLKHTTAYIAIVQINGHDAQDKIISLAESCMQLIEKKHVCKWPGTITRGRRAVQYLYKADKQFFKLLQDFPSFFFNRRDPWGCDLVEETAFGQDDIAFLDKSRNLLFFTTTHEGCAYIERSLQR